MHEKDLSVGSAQIAEVNLSEKEGGAAHVGSIYAAAISTRLQYRHGNIARLRNLDHGM